MNRQDHEQSCRRTFGRPFSKVHAFLDQYSEPGYRVHVHRRIFHHRLGMELIRKKFGREAALAAELHIREDGLVRPDGDIIHHWDDWEWIFFRKDKEREEQAILLAHWYGEEYESRTKTF